MPEKNPNVIQWRCPNCGRLLGNLMVDTITGAECLHVKEKDCHLVIFGGANGWIRRICPGCGSSQQIDSKSSEQGFENNSR